MRYRNQTTLRLSRLHPSLLCGARLQPKTVKTVAVQAKRGLSVKEGSCTRAKLSFFADIIVRFKNLFTYLKFIYLLIADAVDGDAGLPWQGTDRLAGGIPDGGVEAGSQVHTPLG